MAWDFVVDIAFYAFLGLLFFVPCTYLVASGLSVEFPTARAHVRDYLRQWVASAEGDALGTLLGFAGVSTVLIVLAFGAYGANRIGDAAMPLTSRAVYHFGKDLVEWSIVHDAGDWADLRFDFREISGIRGDEVAWERAKADMGRYDIRFFRMAVILFFILFVSGLIDLGRSFATRGSKDDATLDRPRLRIRAGALLLIGISGMLVSQFLWADRQEKFVENLVARYKNVHLTKKGSLPLLRQSYPSYPRNDR